MAARSRNTKPDVKTVRSVERACDILFTFHSLSPTLSPADIAEKIGLPKTTTYRILKALESRGLVQRDPQTLKFSLGFKIFQLGADYYNQMDIRKIALPYMRELSDNSKEAVSLNIVQNQRRVCIERIESQGIIRYYLPLGASTPLYIGATGKVLMAFLSQKEIEQIISRQIVNNPEARNVDVVRLRKELAEIRAKGYAYTNDEFGLGIDTVAAVINGYPGSAVTCINITGLANSFSSEKVSMYTKLLVDAARDISELLGGRT